MELIERVAEAIIGAQCLGREGPFGGYDYGHNTEFYGPAPEGGRYVIRDFRTPKSSGEWLHQTDDNELHQSTLKKMTEEHIAKAAIRAMLDGVEPGSVILRREVFDFLMGVGDLEGVSFGELHEGLPGRFWWRSVLRAAERETSLDALKEAVK